MNKFSYIETLLNLLLEGNVGRCLIINSLGVIKAIYPISQQNRLIGKPLLLALRYFIPSERNLVINAFQQVLIEEKPQKLIKILRKDQHQLNEYYNLSFYPLNKDVLILITDVTEQVLIEEEFTAVTEQYESVNRELYAAMTKQDFYLMDLEQTKKQISALYRISSIVQRTVNQNEVLSEILKEIAQAFGFVNLSIYLLDDQANNLLIKAWHSYSNYVPQNNPLPLGKGIIGLAAEAEEIIYVPNVAKDKRYIDSGCDTVTEIAIPLIGEGRLLGVFNIETGELRHYRQHDLELFQSLANQIAMTILHAEHVKTIQTQAITDGMTGLYNYRYFRSLLHQEIKRAKRYQRPLAMLMLDIDHFKKYNDAYGHQAGDAILKQVAYLIKSTVRDVDHVIRYGGEEFVTLLPETLAFDAAEIAERIRKTVANYPFLHRENQPLGVVSLSIGVAAYPHDAETDVELIEHADMALYSAKEDGRNRTKLFSNV